MTNKTDVNEGSAELHCYVGFLDVRDYGESEDVLFIDSHEEPFAEVLEDDISGRVVTARYWITDKACTRDQAVESFVKRLYGMAECEFCVRYSEITGYLWTDEEINIGGHNLLEELATHKGKHLILEVELPT